MGEVTHATRSLTTQLATREIVPKEINTGYAPSETQQLLSINQKMIHTLQRKAIASSKKEVIDTIGSLVKSLKLNAKRFAMIWDQRNAVQSSGILAGMVVEIH